MRYNDFKGEKISALALGAMRLPKKEENGEIDEELAEKMIEYALKNGINYIDTAYPYHGGKSESFLGKALKKYPRESFFLADKFPGHQIMENYDVKGIFEEQLGKCQTDYFDFYLLHNVCESSIPVYEDERWGIIEYLKEQKKAGRIRHLGLSSHAQPEALDSFLSRHSEDIEFCQIQLNYLDYSLQNAKEKCEILKKYNIPVWVMEPVRGGKLARLDEMSEEKLKSHRPDESIASWAFRWLDTLPEVTTVLSGMSNMEQLCDNIKTFETEKPLTKEENELLFEIAEKLKNSVPCTSCRYCTDGCPAGLDIPRLIAAYNDLRFEAHFNVGMFIDSLPEESRPDACLSCGACAAVCPQKIDIPKTFADFTERLKSVPKWADICREREKAAKMKK